MRRYDDSDRHEKTCQSNKKASYGFISAGVVTVFLGSWSKKKEKKIPLALKIDTWFYSSNLPHPEKDLASHFKGDLASLNVDTNKL